MTFGKKSLLGLSVFLCSIASSFANEATPRTLSTEDKTAGISVIVTLAPMRWDASDKLLTHPGYFGDFGRNTKNIKIVKMRIVSGGVELTPFEFHGTKPFVDLLNPSSIKLDTKKGKLKGRRVDWTLLIQGGDGGESYIADFGFERNNLVARVIRSALPEPLAKTVETTFYGEWPEITPNKR